jgi:26S proteasome regulatory subunit T4
LFCIHYYRSTLKPHNNNNDVLVRLGLRDFDKNFEKTEDDIKALQSVGQIIGEVLKQLDEERCKFLPTPSPSSRFI